MKETKPPTHIIWPNAAIVGTQKHTQNQNSTPPLAKDREQERESSILVDVENNEAIIELRNGECGDNESTKLGSTVPTEMEIKQLPPANNSQDEML